MYRNTIPIATTTEYALDWSSSTTMADIRQWSYLPNSGWQVGGDYTCTTVDMPFDHCTCPHCGISCRKWSKDGSWEHVGGGRLCPGPDGKAIEDDEDLSW